MRFVLASVIPVVIFFSPMLEASSASTPSKFEKSTAVNTWLAAHLNNLPRSKEKIMSKLAPHLEDRDRFDVDSYLKKRASDSNAYKVHSVFDQLVVTDNDNKRWVMRRHPARQHVILVNGQPVEYKMGQILRSLKKYSKPEPKSAWNHIMHLLFGQAVAADEKLPYLSNGIQQELLLMASAHDVIPLNTEKDLETLLTDAGVTQAETQKANKSEPGFLGGLVGGITSYFSSSESDSAASREPDSASDVTEIKCNATSQPPSISGSMKLQGEYLPFEYKNNRLTLHKEEGEGKKTFSLDLAKGGESRANAITPCYIKELMSDSNQPVNLEQKKSLEECMTGGLSYYTRDEHYEATYLAFHSCLEKMDSRGKRLLRGSFDIYMAQYQKEHRRAYKKCEAWSSLGFKETQCQNCKSDSIVAELANDPAKSSALALAQSTHAESSNKLAAIQSEFQKKHGLPEPIGLDRNGNLESVPAGVNISGSDLASYKKILTDQAKKEDAARLAVFAFNRELAELTKPVKEQLADRMLAAVSLLDCCMDNECKARIYQNHGTNIVPSSPGEAVQ